MKKSGYSQKKKVSKGTPRKPKPAATKGGSFAKRKADGTRSN